MREAPDTDENAPHAWLAGTEDAAAAAVLLDAFNAAYEVPTPGAQFLAERLRTLIPDGDAHVLLAGDGPDGVAVVRIRPDLWSRSDVAYLEELYVVPEQRRRGLGNALMVATTALARDLGCARIELGTDEGDEDAHRLYGRHDFTNFVDETTRERMLFLEREL